MQILFSKNPIFFVIPKVCWTVRVFHSLNLESLKRIYALLFKVVMILKTLKQAKTAERNSKTYECIFHQLAVKNVNVNVVRTIYCQRNSIFLGKKNSLFDWPESGLVQAKKYLAGHHDLLSVIFSPVWILLSLLLFSNWGYTENGLIITRFCNIRAK